MVQDGAQFIISTHSPILMAYPGASIFEIQQDQLTPMSFTEVEHVRLTADFVKEPDRYLRHLWDT